MIFPSPKPTRGLTLVEVAVTVAIVSIAIMGCLQGLERSVLSAANTRNTRLARELGLLTIGQIESGLYWDEIDSGLGGSYAEEGYPSFFFEIALGEDTFVDVDPSEGGFDSWAYREEVRQRQLEQDENYDPDDEFEEEQPFEKVRVRVTFADLKSITGNGESNNTVIVEKWVRWEQVYGPDYEDEGSSGGGSSDDGGSLSDG